jgi:hypothetical protein
VACGCFSKSRDSLRLFERRLPYEQPFFAFMSCAWGPSGAYLSPLLARVRRGASSTRLLDSHGQFPGCGIFLFALPCFLSPGG